MKFLFIPIIFFATFLNAQFMFKGTATNITDNYDSTFVDNIVFKKQVQVSSVDDFTFPLKSDVLYLIHGNIDLGTTQIEVPSGGVSLKGLGFGVGGLFSTEDNYTMFSSPADSSGNVFLMGLEISVTGSNSKVFDLVDKTGLNAVEMTTVNFNGCSSLGILDNYRQGLELNTGRFGGTPTLTLSGNWIGGYRATTTITRSVSSSTIQYKAGTNLLMNGRFLTDGNIVLSDGANFCDFSPSNISNIGDFEIIGGRFNGLSDFTQYFPNMSETSIKAYFKENKGVKSTQIGATVKCSATSSTSLTQDVFSEVSGTFETSDTVYFESISNGMGYRYIGDVEDDFLLIGSIEVDGDANDEIEILVRKLTPPSTYEDIFNSRKTVSNLVGGLDLAFFFVSSNVTLNEDEEIQVWMTNRTDNSNATLTTSSYLNIIEK